MTARLAGLGFSATRAATQYRSHQLAHDFPGAARGGVTYDKNSMGQRREALPGTVDRRHWHCMEETNAPPYEGIG